MKAPGVSKVTSVIQTLGSGWEGENSRSSCPLPPLLAPRIFYKTPAGSVPYYLKTEKLSLQARRRLRGTLLRPQVCFSHMEEEATRDCQVIKTDTEVQQPPPPFLSGHRAGSAITESRAGAGASKP